MFYCAPVPPTPPPPPCPNAGILLRLFITVCISLPASWHVNRAVSPPSFPCIRPGWQFGVQAIGSDLPWLVWGLQCPPGLAGTHRGSRGGGGGSGSRTADEPALGLGGMAGNGTHDPPVLPCTPIPEAPVHPCRSLGVAEEGTGRGEGVLGTSKLGCGGHGLFFLPRVAPAALCVPSSRWASPC